MAIEHQHLRTTVNQDGAAILDTRQGTISTLNATGAYVWDALERGESPEVIAANLARETGEPIDAVMKDVQDFLDVLKEKHLLPR